MKINKLYFIILLCLVFTNCDKFEYNVNQTNLEKHDPSVTTEYNIARLLNLPRKDSLHVVFIGDLHRFYEETEDLVNAVNNLPEVDALVVTGDIVDFGTARNYEFINRILKSLKVPFITVMGNHDCLSNGTELYEDIYGPFNYSFIWNDIRFVALNTNSREFSFNGKVPDIDWMKQQLIDTADYNGCIFISHVPPMDEDFDKSLETEYENVIFGAKNTILCANGHRHNYAIDQPYHDDIWYLNTSSPEKRVFCYVTIFPYATSDKKFDCIPVSF